MGRLEVNHAGKKPDNIEKAKVRANEKELCRYICGACGFDKLNQDNESCPECGAKLDWEEVLNKQAINLPLGWIWTHYDDGSGGLMSPEGNKYFSYDLSTYEYVDLDRRWAYFPQMDLPTFKLFAEEKIKSTILKREEKPIMKSVDAMMKDITDMKN